MADAEIFCALEKLLPKLRGLGVGSLRLFGSAARDELKPSSDIDVLVDFEKGDASHYFEVLFLLEDTLGRSVDLVIPETLHRRIRGRVIDEALRVA